LLTKSLSSVNSGDAFAVSPRDGSSILRQVCLIQQL
jgi:hypothetical protein